MPKIPNRTTKQIGDDYGISKVELDRNLLDFNRSKLTINIHYGTEKITKDTIANYNQVEIDDINNIVNHSMGDIIVALDTAVVQGKITQQKRDTFVSDMVDIDKRISDMAAKVVKILTDIEFVKFPG